MIDCFFLSKRRVCAFLLEIVYAHQKLVSMILEMVSMKS
ncbi:hypothetical protein QIA_1757 [Clostridioides difficile 6057]|nr:hypothetical protein QCS_1791 [Clostridioides difficile CD51]EQE80747.1 hypothetical protein QCU_1746 [Clostridioides difficile CD68]EQF11229.1 hypothetical protein QEO_1861 [Clostridioides difficile CD133]EQF45686.1 hypothetical protein QG5_1741 [Clostridioides difficile CD170]EQF89024.1 hypothetical protein QGU_1836 [Clostridioides difficile 655]EQG05951.1 hypothetical protein QI7_0410 [Clostridioides difficile 6042]EQG11640.1 hypothetical protein QIA_1757 [Clostridioides difficile 6057]